ncbi:hypothetical protein DM02DRAFT_613508 [Periconia macrospinosa]|uniref:Uncharacterized protein n=1 Tax=Periconia macrospinosa TaxID=97972 RepID=A0A2V1DXW5_9PLEO|nr:hypothetical protein DM02DRAFT_613508 [Periconia macrospinosa]
MKASFTSIATTLLGLGSVLTGVTAVPTTNKQLSARATVPDIKAAPYSYEVTERPGLGGKATFSVNRKGSNVAFLNVISVDTKANMVKVEDANNDKDPRENRIPLRDIAMYLYASKAPQKDPKTLKKISFAPVVEKKSTNPTIKACQKKLGKTSFKVTPSSTGKEKEVFNDLAKTVFGRSVAHYKSDYGLNVGAIEIVGGSENFNMDFHMQTGPVAGPAPTSSSAPASSSSAAPASSKSKPPVPPKPTKTKSAEPSKSKPPVPPKPTKTKAAEPSKSKPPVPAKPTKKPKKGSKN